MTTPSPTLAEAFAAVFGTEVPRPCVHCSRPTLDVAHHFTEGNPESGPFAWTEPAHPECTERMVAEAEAYAQGYEDAERARMGDEAYDAMVATHDAWAAELEALATMPKVAGCRASALNATCDRCQLVAPVLYERDSYTVGRAGHPGAEVTAWGLCAPCLQPEASDEWEDEDDAMHAGPDRSPWAHGPGCDGPYNCTCGYDGADQAGL